VHMAGYGKSLSLLVGARGFQGLIMLFDLTQWYWKEEDGGMEHIL
jgi:hypothetical protein